LTSRIAQNPIRCVNDSYQPRARDSTIDLTILTALSLLQARRPHSAMEMRACDARLAHGLLRAYVEPE